MREILFRGKRIDNGEWEYGDLSQPRYNCPHQALIYNETTFDFQVDPSTVSQFTGLFDKNGKRIFEGDIARLFFVDGEEVGEIAWDEEWCKVVFISPDGSKYGVDGTVEFEVIGNKWDNPELLKGDQT